MSAATTKGAEIRVILAGYGQVGRNFHALALKAVPRVKVVAVARSSGAAADTKGLPLDPQLAPGRSVDDLLATVDADVFVEAMPTNLRTGEPGLRLIETALGRGLHAVVADKGPLVHGFKRLRDRAQRHGRALRFEATVGGAIPTLNLVEHGFSGNPVERIDGILNGTSNFILTRMLEEGMDFAAALEEARELGYAEADPSNDVDGTDAGAKLTILANAVLDRGVRLDEVAISGIRDITAGAMRIAREEGYAIRLVASVDRSKGRATVRPRLVERGDPLDVGGALNVIRYQTLFGGAFTITGRGAGGPETATAVLSDVLAAGAADAHAPPNE